ncbi:MAG: DUF5615 family PIN-like protein [Dehalococcoidia bacterium]
MTVVAYLLDENVDPRLGRGIERRWPAMGVRQVGQDDAPAFGTSDPDILRWCEANDVSLVTNNRRSMPPPLREHLAVGRHVPGIFVIEESETIGETMERLALIWGASDGEEYRDQLVYLAQVT